MKFFADENVARTIIQWLRQAGHDVFSAAETGPGEDDAVWLRQAEQSERLIVTSDKDFDFQASDAVRKRKFLDLL